jgi:hypothetical protein
VKNAYLTRLGIPVAWSSGLFLAAYAAVRVGASFGFESRHGVVPSEVLANVALLLAGCAGGVWLSFGARKTTLTSDELAVPEADRLHPMVRVISATLLTLVLALGAGNQGRRPGVDDGPQCSTVGTADRTSLRFR